MGAKASDLTLPTPAAADSWDIQQPRKDSTMMSGGKHAVSLMALGHAGLLPIPTARDWKGPQGRAYQGKVDDLGGIIRFRHGMSGQLNPRFVAEMMGFPPDWTILPFLNGEKKVSIPTVMP